MKLTVIHSDNATIKDYSSIAWDFRRDTFDFNYKASEDFLYIGSSKPINMLYVELNALSVVATTLTLKYWNGTAWTAVTKHDDTKAFTRSGFITWEANQTNEAKTTVNSVEQYYYQLSFAADLTTTTKVMAVNIVFSDDNDLYQDVSNIASYLPTGESDYINKHVSSRNDIIQKIRNDGKFKVSLSDGFYKDIDAFDLLSFEQIRIASKYLTLHKIFFDLSNDLKDAHYERAKSFLSSYTQAMNVFYLDLDKNNDGKLDVDERLKDYGCKVIRR